MKRFLCILLCLAVLCGQAFAVTTADSLDKQVEDFIDDHDLNETNFSYFFYNTVSKISYSYNMNGFFPVGEVWTLPLNMYYYEQEAKGAYQAPVTDPDWKYTIGGMDLDECRYHSILEHDAEVSAQMRDNLGDLQQYKLLINERFGQLKTATLPDSYLGGNAYSAAFLMNCLLAIYKHPEQFADMMQNYGLAQEDNGIASYSNAYHVTHVYGKEDGMICDVGQINAPQNYLLVVFVSEAAGGDEILAELNDLLCDTIELEAGVFTGDDDTKTHARSDSDFIVSSADRNDHSEAITWVLWAVGGAVVLLLIGGGIFWFINRRREYDSF